MGITKKGLNIALGWVAVNLIDFKRRFVNSQMTLRLWPNEKANPIGISGGKLEPAKHDIIIKIEFTTFAKFKPKVVVYYPFVQNEESRSFFPRNFQVNMSG